MKNKGIRRMSRMELLDIISALQEKEEKLVKEKEQLEMRLEERVIKMENLGSIAEAALSINDVFKSAQAAAEQYLESVRYAKKEALEEAEEIVSNAKAKAETIIAEAKEEADKIRSDKP